MYHEKERLRTVGRAFVISIVILCRIGRPKRATRLGARDDNQLTTG